MAARAEKTHSQAAAAAGPGAGGQAEPDVRDGTGSAPGEPQSWSQYARSLIEAIIDPLVTISPEGTITDANEAAVRVTGRSRTELAGAGFADFFTEPDQAREAYRRMYAEGGVKNFPMTMRRADGETMDVVCNASVYKDAAGRVQGVCATAHDVTESNRLLRELAEANNFLDNILQSSTRYSIMGTDLSHRILSWNEGARRNYGYDAAEIVGEECSLLHAPEDIESGAVGRLHSRAYQQGVAEGTYERIRKDGSRFVASVVLTRRDDAQGKPIGYLLISSDISEQKRAEEQLREASQYARSLIEASRDPLVTISPEGTITDVNEATVRVTGTRRQELIGTDFSEYFTEPEQAREGYRRVFAEGFVTDYPLTIRHASGDLTDVLYNASVYQDATGHVRGVFAAARDVTARKAAEREAAEQRAREQDRLAELERFQQLTVGRELRMIELKKEIERLRAAAGGR